MGVRERVRYVLNSFALRLKKLTDSLGSTDGMRSRSVCDSHMPMRPHSVPPL